MLEGIRNCWKTFVESKVFPLVVFIIAVAVYCNFGWALGYVLSSPESVPHWLRFLADPFLLATDVNVAYISSAQTFFVVIGPLLWVAVWMVYVFALCFGGIATLLIMP
ncbi:MAG: hypothetical protein NTZ13_04660 [Candidatus Parcubacteria bacterium]|nr:hypothetical protein [Candidatus Parcubacteria bacterium]